MSPTPSADIAISRRLSNFLLTLSLLGVIALAAWPLMMDAVQGLCVAMDVVGVDRCTKAPGKLLSYAAVIGAFPAILLLERVWPASKQQHRFSPAVLVDFLWFCFSPVFLVVFIMPVEEALRWLHDDYFGFRAHLPIESLPFVWQFVIVALLSDFLLYVAHVVRHKSSFVWAFHKIHHSQEELNYFSASRVHPVDGLTINLVRFIPFAMLALNMAVPAFVAWKILVNIYAMYTHSNIRMNLGVLRYVLVTPQSHRVHHSDLPEHRDRNFGNMLAIWDFMFGTQCLDFDTYPPTGIEDKSIPRPTRPTLASSLGALARMLVHPLVSLTRPPLAAQREPLPPQTTTRTGGTKESN